MIDILLIGGLVTGLIWNSISKSSELYQIAKRFTIWWGVGLALFLLSAIIGGVTIPGGPQDSNPAMMLIGVIWLAALSTLGWTLVTTVWNLYLHKRQ